MKILLAGFFVLGSITAFASSDLECIHAQVRELDNVDRSHKGLTETVVRIKNLNEKPDVAPTVKRVGNKLIVEPLLINGTCVITSAEQIQKSI